MIELDSEFYTGPDVTYEERAGRIYIKRYCNVSDSVDDVNT
jgi:hypothetical protein